MQAVHFADILFQNIELVELQPPESLDSDMNNNEMSEELADGRYMDRIERIFIIMV